MDKETAHLEQQISELTDVLIRYQTAYEILMEHFDELPNDIAKSVSKKLDKIQL